MARPKPLSPLEARAFIDRVLSRRDSLVLTQHCRDRANDRRFDIYDIRVVLACGETRVHEWDERHQNWKYEVSGLDSDGESALTVIVVLDAENDLIRVVTGYG